MSSARRRHVSVRSLVVSATLVGLVAVATAGAAGATPPPAAGRPTIFMKVHDARPVRGGGSVNLTYHGGVGGSGVVTGADNVYLIYWGSQWGTKGSNDPSGQVVIQQGFFSHVGGSSWNNSVTQYCQNIPTGTTDCSAASQLDHAANPSGVLAGTLFDSSSVAPSHPTQGQLAAEAIRAAQIIGNTTANQNKVVQYVINTSSGNNSTGFGTQWCAWHSSTGSIYGNIAYTNMPYMTDAGASCGANFNNLGPNAGITIVGGHEFAETETDIFPNGGWLDRGGAENGDKCAWIGSGQGVSASVSLNGVKYPVQSLWSNAFNGGAGGCVNSY
jgi:hypothetical protein